FITMRSFKKTWILCEAHKTGTFHQLLGLADFLGKTGDITHYPLVPRSINRYLPPTLWIQPLKTPTQTGALLTPPWPELVLAAGRGAVAPALSLKKKGCKVIFVLNPYIRPKFFDVVISPEHDQLTGDNVIQIPGVLHHLTDKKLKEAYERFCFDPLKKPFISLLIGGEGPHYHYQDHDILDLIEKAKTMAYQKGASLLVTASRRTKEKHKHLIQTSLQTFPHFYWDEKGENPYLGLLTHAQDIIVTSDSISMICEACFTGKPVYIYTLPIKSKKFQFFLKTLFKGQYALPFESFDPFIPKKFCYRQSLEKIFQFL
ncbi:MAG: mitochondrial fission ELM1 family protein, partial [Proteobacteria bacterium]|nr:mitochondrial fission ELM1 family protein [Pseudomonadota bacterium]